MTLVRFAPHSDTLGAEENYAVLTDKADEAEIKLREAEYADTRTRAIRAGIAALGTNITELEVGAIVSSLIGATDRSGWSHTTTGVNTMERLLDAQGVLEGSCE